MIYELNRNEYINLLQLNKYYNVEIPAILSGFNSGKVYADSKTEPQTAMIWTKDGSFFIGDTNNKRFDNYINEFIDSNIKPMSKSLGIKWLEMCSVSKEWSEKIEELFGYRKLDRSNQFVFRMSEINENTLDLKRLPNDIKLSAISKDFFEQPFRNKEYFTEGILEFWESLDEFCDKGFGVFVNSKRVQELIEKGSTLFCSFHPRNRLFKTMARCP